METESPPKSVSSSSSSNVVVVQPISSTQPTYTTAGTIYKPSSSQPLQPPTRRGRSSKWPLGGLQSDLALLPKSVLAGLPLKAPFGRPITALQHYTPLQQNYDRAISPFAEQDHILAKILPKTPLMRPENTPGPSALPPSTSSSSDATQIKFVMDGQESYSEDESAEGDNKDLSSDPLMSMTVKSLQNLASYPNPNQEKARKALQRSSRPRPTNLGYSALNSGSSSPPPLSRISPSVSSSSNTGSMPNELHRVVTADSASGRRAHRDVLAKIDNAVATGSNSTITSRENLELINGTAEASLSLLSNVPSGNGTPLPLTAGPPGLRQYRPSTFESTFRALNCQSPAVQHGLRDEESLLITSQTLMQAGIEDESLTADSVVSLLCETFEFQRSVNPKVRELSILHTPAPTLPNSPGNTSQTYAQQQNENLPLFTSGGWQDQSPDVRAQYKPGTDRLTDVALATKNDKLDASWYARVNMHRRATRTKGPFECNLTSSEPRLGVIGDKRPRRDQRQSGTVDIDTAIQTTSEPTESLLEMACQSLSQIKDDPLAPWANKNGSSSSDSPDHRSATLSRPRDAWTLASPARASS